MTTSADGWIGRSAGTGPAPRRDLGQRRIDVRETISGRIHEPTWANVLDSHADRPKGSRGGHCVTEGHDDRLIDAPIEHGVTARRIGLRISGGTARPLT